MTSMGHSLGVWNILLHGSARAPDMTLAATPLRGIIMAAAPTASIRPGSDPTQEDDQMTRGFTRGVRLSWRGQILTWRGRELLWHPGDNPRMTLVDKPPQHGPPE